MARKEQENQGIKEIGLEHRESRGAIEGGGVSYIRS